MNEFCFQNFQAEFLPALTELQRICTHAKDDSSLMDASFFLSPGFNNGKNIELAFDKSGNLQGYATILPLYQSGKLEGAQIFRLEMQVMPEIEPKDNLLDHLLVRVRARAEQIKAEMGIDKAVLSCSHFSSNPAAISFLESRGFKRYESFFEMHRDLSVWIVDHQPPQDIEVRAWRMQTEEERCQYVQAYRKVFYERSLNEDDLASFCRSEMWMAGTTFSAFKGEALVGSVMAFYDPNLRRNTDRAGSIEHMFVLEEERNRGIGSALLGQALIYLKQRGLRFAKVEMAAVDPEPLGFFETAGFELFREEIAFGLNLG